MANENDCDREFREENYKCTELGEIAMANETLSKAKNAKNDEFYTQYEGIQREINAYLEYKGGETDIKNCQMLCKTHNRAKGIK